LHARQQTLAMLDTTTGEVVEKTLTHEGSNVREFYSALPRPVRVGIEATGSMQWFVKLMEELGIECQVGHPTKIRAAEPRKQKHDRRDADLILKLLVENRFPSIWLLSKELFDLRALLLHRHQWVRMRTRIPVRTVDTLMDFPLVLEVQRLPVAKWPGFPKNGLTMAG
jgi:transposase